MSELDNEISQLDQTQQRYVTEMEKANEAISRLEEKRKLFERQKYDYIKIQHLIRLTKDEVDML